MLAILFAKGIHRHHHHGSVHPSRGDVKGGLQELHTALNKQQMPYQDMFFIIARDFNHANFKTVELCYQYVGLSAMFPLPVLALAYSALMYSLLGVSSLLCKIVLMSFSVQINPDRK